MNRYHIQWTQVHATIVKADSKKEAFEIALSCYPSETFHHIIDEDTVITKLNEDE
jgi:hypothetical protein